MTAEVDVKTFDTRRRMTVSVGCYDRESKIFTKRVELKHKLRLFNGYGIQSKVLQGLKDMGCEWVRLIQPEKSFLNPISAWLGGKEIDFGHGPQRFLTEYQLIEEINKGGACEIP